MANRERSNSFNTIKYFILNATTYLTNTGWEDYNYDCEFSEVLGLIRNGAELNIENPEEFADYEEDE